MFEWKFDNSHKSCDLGRLFLMHKESLHFSLIDCENIFRIRDTSGWILKPEIIYLFQSLNNTYLQKIPQKSNGNFLDATLLRLKNSAYLLFVIYTEVIMINTGN